MFQKTTDISPLTITDLSPCRTKKDSSLEEKILFIPSSVLNLKEKTSFGDILTKEDNEEVPFLNRKIGKISIYKSGKKVLNINENRFLLEETEKTFQNENILSLDLETKEAKVTETVKGHLITKIKLNDSNSI